MLKLPRYPQIVNICLLQIKTSITDNKPGSSQVLGSINYSSYHSTSVQYFVTEKPHTLSHNLPFMLTEAVSASSTKREHQITKESNPIQPELLVA